MKKLTVLFSLAVFLFAFAPVVSASQVTTDIAISVNDDDPKKSDCSKEKKADCSKEKKAECTKEEKADCKAEKKACCEKKESCEKKKTEE